MTCGDYFFESRGAPPNQSDQEGTEVGQNGEVLPLVIYCLLAVLGSTVNIFHISALVIQEHLRHRVNVFLANQALANLLVTLLAFPAFCIAILADRKHDPAVHDINWYSSVLCFLVTSSNGLLLSFCHALHCRPNGRIVGSAVVVTWLLSAFLILLPPHCPTFHSNFYLLFLAPLFASFVLFLIAVYNVKKQKAAIQSREEHYQRHLMKSNLVAHVLVVCFWTPFVVALGVEAEPSVLGNLLAFAQFSCLAWGLVYPASHPAFGQAFLHLTRYFCLKTHPEFSKSCQDKPQQGMVRVHMMGMEARMHRGQDQDAREKPEEIFL